MPGRPRTYDDDDDRLASVINRALQETPDTATHWTTRALGQAEGLSKSTVQRVGAGFGMELVRGRSARCCEPQRSLHFCHMNTMW